MQSTDIEETEKNEGSRVGRDQLPDGAKRVHRVAALAIHHRNHEFHDEPDDHRDEKENDSKEDEKGQREEGIIPIPAKDKDQGEPAKDEHAAEGDDELDNEVAVALGPEFVPGFGDRAAITHDAVSEHETAARVEPEEEHDDGKEEEAATDDDWDDPGRDIVH